jgi:hypothetical protein
MKRFDATAHNNFLIQIRVRSKKSSHLAPLEVVPFMQPWAITMRQILRICTDGGRKVENGLHVIWDRLRWPRADKLISRVQGQRWRTEIQNNNNIVEQSGSKQYIIKKNK